MTVRTHTRHALLLGVTALLATGMLTACSFGGGEARPSGTTGAERSHIEAADAIAELPGITSAEISSSTEGTPNQVMLFARVSAEAGYAGAPAELLDYVVRQAWSTTENEPTTTVRVELTVEGQDLDLVALAAEIGLAGTVNTKNKYDSSVRIRVDDVAAAYGTWPGPVPTPPASLTGAAG